MTSQNTILQGLISFTPPNIYNLNNSVTIPSSVIDLPAGSIFNGNNYVISFNTYGLALFNIIGDLNNATVINNLTVTSIGIFNEGGGGLLESYSKNVILNNCIFNGDILQPQSGGLIGKKCSNVAIINSTFNGNINNNSGGITGTKCSSIKIINTNVNGNINGKYSGGFVGNSCKNIYIFNCIYTGNIEGKYSAGFVGSNSKKVKIINSISNANKFNYSGGFCAAYSYNIKMINCTSTGIINKCTSSMLACKCGKGGKYIKIIKCTYNLPIYTKLISYTNLTIKN